MALNVNDKIEEFAKIGDRDSVIEIIRLGETYLASRSFAIQKLAALKSEDSIQAMFLLGKLSFDDADTVIGVFRKDLQEGVYNKEYQISVAEALRQFMKFYPDHSSSIMHVFEEFDEEIAVKCIVSAVQDCPSCIDDAMTSLKSLYNGHPQSAAIGAMFFLMKNVVSGNVPALSNFISLRERFTASAHQMQVDIVDQFIKAAIYEFAHAHVMSQKTSDADAISIYSEMLKAMKVAEIDPPAFH